MLSLKDKYDFRFLNFLMIGFSNSFPNYWIDIILFLIADLSRVAKVSDRARVTASSEDFLSKNS